MFGLFESIGVSIKPTKAFIRYPSVQLFGQRVNSLGLSTPENKLKVISQLKFPTTLKKLKIYLGIAGYLRHYVSFFAQVSRALQIRKIELLKPALKEGQAKKNYAAKTLLEIFTELKKISFRDLQFLLSLFQYLTYFELKENFYVNFDIFADSIEAIVYYVKNNRKKHANIANSKIKTYPAKISVIPIIFLSRLLINAEKKYWPTELKIAELI